MNEIETHVLEMIGENTTSPDVFTEGSDSFDQIRGSINDAIEEISLFTGGLKRSYKLPIRKDVNFYRLNFTSEYVSWITQVWLYGVKRRLTQVDFVGLRSDNPRWLYNSGSPTSYFMVGENILGIHPAPTASTDMLEIKAVVVPFRYEEDIDRVKLRDQFKWAAVHYAVGEYYASRGDAKRALNFHKAYMKGLGLNEQYPWSAEKNYQYQSFKQTGGKVEEVRP